MFQEAPWSLEGLPTCFSKPPTIYWIFYCGHLLIHTFDGRLVLWWCYSPRKQFLLYTISCHYGKTLGIPADIHILSSQSLFQAHGFNLADFASPKVKEHTCGDPIKKLWGKKNWQNGYLVGLLRGTSTNEMPHVILMMHSPISQLNCQDTQSKRNAPGFPLLPGIGSFPLP